VLLTEHAFRQPTADSFRAEMIFSGPTSWCSTKRSLALSLPQQLGRYHANVDALFWGRNNNLARSQISDVEHRTFSWPYTLPGARAPRSADPHRPYQIPFEFKEIFPPGIFTKASRSPRLIQLPLSLLYPLQRSQKAVFYGRNPKESAALNSCYILWLCATFSAGISLQRLSVKLSRAPKFE
jgi:hypothetical protein